jgi:hypothetical protein
MNVPNSAPTAIVSRVRLAAIAVSFVTLPHLHPATPAATLIQINLIFRYKAVAPMPAGG